MNLRDQATLKWVNAKRPDLSKMMNDLLTRGMGNKNIDDAYRLLLSIGFEAGRRFQADRPKTELDNPNVYLELPNGV